MKYKRGSFKVTMDAYSKALQRVTRINKHKSPKERRTTINSLIHDYFKSL